jgi:hypothetical protein
MDKLNGKAVYEGIYYNIACNYFFKYTQILIMGKDMQLPSQS